VVFCGVLRVFCDVLRVFCGVLRVFCSISTKHTKHPKNIEKHWKTRKTHNTLVYCGSFPRAKKIDCIAQNTFHKTSAKHRKTLQNTAKQSQNAFCEITSHNTAKVTLNTPNARKRHKTLTIQLQYVLRAFGVFSQNTLDLSRKHTIPNIRVHYAGGGHVLAGGRVAGLWMFFKNSVLRCFAVFCGVLRCFACVLLAVFTKQQKTDQKVYKTHKTNKIRFVQYSAIRCCASFSHSENVYKKIAKHVQNIGKHPQNTAKHCLKKNTRKTPQNTRQTPAKHRKTPQNTFANKTDRISIQTAPLPLWFQIKVKTYFIVCCTAISIYNVRLFEVNGYWLIWRVAKGSP